MSSHTGYPTRVWATKPSMHQCSMRSCAGVPSATSATQRWIRHPRRKQLLAAICVYPCYVSDEANTTTR